MIFKVEVRVFKAKILGLGSKLVKISILKVEIRVINAKIWGYRVKFEFLRSKF